MRKRFYALYDRRVDYITDQLYSIPEIVQFSGLKASKDDVILSGFSQIILMLLTCHAHSLANWPSVANRVIVFGRIHPYHRKKWRHVFVLSFNLKKMQHILHSVLWLQYSVTSEILDAASLNLYPQENRQVRPGICASNYSNSSILWFQMQLPNI